MTYQEPCDRVIQDYKRRRDRHWIAMACFSLVMFSTVALIVYPDTLHRWGLESSFVTWIPMAVFVGYAIFTLVDWRCPGCNAYLGKTFDVNFCPKCGIPFKMSVTPE